MWARKGRKGPPRSRCCRWKRERAARDPLRPSPPPAIPRLFLFFLFGTVGDRGAFIHAHIPRMQRACECVRYTHGAPGGGPRGGTWRRGWDDYFHYVDLQDEKRVEPKKWWNTINTMYIIIVEKFKKSQYYCCSFFLLNVLFFTLKMKIYVRFLRENEKWRKLRENMFLHKINLAVVKN